MDRIQELESILNCKVLYQVTEGESLEKYKAVIDGSNVLLRIYDDDYYTNRFLREGLVLRSLQRENTDITTPQIIDEWPEYQIRAIKWFNFEKSDLEPHETKRITEWMRSLTLTVPYDLKNDIIPHLLNSSTIHIAYREYFETHVDNLLDHINWNEGNHGLLHGDFHKDNFGKTDKGLVVFDWEYATMGSDLYDLAYLQVVNQIDLAIEIPSEWKLLVLLVNAHWYLQETHFSPKDAIKWVDKIGEIDLN